MDTWKKLIRVLTHEMNNSLAPISSLTASAQKITASGNGTEKLDEIYQSIGNRASHLQSFIEQYARFARLPMPRIQSNDWKSFVDTLHRLVDFQLAEDLPEKAADFDPVQMEQVLINLLKNSAESGSSAGETRLRVLQNSKEVLIAVEDRGSGMDVEQMQLAVDRANVCPYRTVADAKLGGGLCIRLAAHETAQHVQLTVGKVQPVGRCGRCSGLTPCIGVQFAYDVEHCARYRRR